MIESRKLVPEYYSKSRDFQVFLKIVDLVINAAKADIDYFTSLISPEHCKARMLPLLGHYVGCGYDFQESVRMNRIIIKNWPVLKHYRGSFIGISMAVALAFNQMEDANDSEILRLFNVDLEKSTDRHGRTIRKIKVYVYSDAYLSKMYDLIEAVRPAGTIIEITPAVSISSSETIVLTDEFRMLGYDYCTGKLLKIGNVPIYVENSWQILKDGVPTDEYVVDGELYDSSHISLNKYVDDQQRIVNGDGTYTGEVIIAPEIYRESTNDVISTGHWKVDVKLDTSEYSSLVISQVKDVSINTIEVPILTGDKLQSSIPIVNEAIYNNQLRGTGVPDASISVKIKNTDRTYDTVVNTDKTWSVTIPDIQPHWEFRITQHEDNKELSNEVICTTSQVTETTYKVTVCPLTVSAVYDNATAIKGTATPGYKIIIKYKKASGEEVTLVDNLHKLEPTGKYFNLNHAARVLNTCYQIRCGGTPTNYYISADYWKVMNAEKDCFYILKDYMMGNVLVKKVFDNSGEIKYNWHIDLDTGFFVQDDEGEPLDSTLHMVPWDENCYISKKRYIMNVTANDIMYVTEYFVNKYEDIEDNAGNIILSKKDRYKVSDSTTIGFSQVHDIQGCTTDDKTWIYAREHSYTADKDYYNIYAREDYNDYNTNGDYVDTRIKITPSDLSVDQIIREYDATNNIGVIDETAEVEDDSTSIVIPIEKLMEDIETNEPKFYVNVLLRPGDTILSVFSELRFTFDTERAGIREVFLDWKLKEGAEMYYNVYELPDRLIFTHKGTIKPRRLKFTEEPLHISSKVYDGTITPPQNWEIQNNNN